MVALETRSLGSGLVHSEIEIKVGPSDYDRIVVHRIVARDRTRFRCNARYGAMLLPSEIFDFEHYFLPPDCAQAPSDTPCFARFLALQGIDVWGLDFRMAAVPADTEQFDFMANWGLNAHLADTRLAMRVACNARKSSVMLPCARLDLLAAGRGVFIAFALAVEETQLAPSERSIGGLIPLDGVFQWAPDENNARDFSCGEENSYLSRYRSGTYHESYISVRQYGQAAVDDPDGQSSLNEDYTNREYALAVGATTYRGYEPVQDFHYLAGELDDDGTPTHFLYADEDRWFRALAAAVPFESTALYRDVASIACGETDQIWDDHLSEIAVPTLYVGAAGGYGDLGAFVTSELASTDVSTLIVQHQNPEQRAVDFGHLDFWFSEAAETEVWELLADWIKGH
jgi:hypothetical protein